MAKYTTTNLQHRDFDSSDIGDIPALEKGNVRVIPLSGVEEVGKNMNIVEVGDDIIVIDAGYTFENEDYPGIDYLLPNTRYLEERKDKIRGLFITHGHLDHIGGIPYVMERLGNPTIYCRKFTELMIRKRQEEFPDQDKLDIQVVEPEDELTVGDMDVRFYGYTHSIPDNMGVIVDTPHGQVINQADFELEHDDGVVSDEDEAVFNRVAEKDTLLLMADSTNVEKPGFHTPEHEVYEGLEQIIKETSGGRLFIGSFASQIKRLIKIIGFAIEDGRKVVLEGYSMRTNVSIIREAGLIDVPEETFISTHDASNMSPDDYLILATGTQGEEFAALNRMANGTHKHMSFRPEDTIVFSSSVVPGNEKAVASLKDNIAQSGATIMTDDNSEMTIHSSGHGHRGELKWLHEKLQPEYFVPQHGRRYMLELHKKLAIECGTPEENIIVPENGSVIEIQDNASKIIEHEQKAAEEVMTVDGLNIGDVQDVVIRDREILQEEGIFVVIVAVNPENGELRKSPDLISRGFVYLRESKQLLKDARTLVKNVVHKATKGRDSVNFDHIKSRINDRVRSFLQKRTGKKPLVIPVVLGV
jgi:ribonuclease J